MSKAAARGAACLWVLVACSGPYETPPPAVEPEVVSPRVVASTAVSGPGCPPGMVRVAGSGTVGMRGQPYAIIPTGHLKKVDAPERRCPSALASTPEATACWVQTDLVDPVLKPRDVSVSDFCIDADPFPGAGVPYPVDGMTAGTVALLDELLQTGRFGPRRLCTATELQLAIAGPVANHRFVYGDEADPARCKAGEEIGRDDRCRNPETGVREYGAIHSQWARADAAFVQSACDAPPCLGAGNRPLKVGAYVVIGGTSRVQTRQAPLTPHTWHDHGEPADPGCGDEGWDDQVAICADPDERFDAQRLPATLASAEQAWSSVVTRTRNSGRVTAGIAQGLGRSICPSGAPR